MELGCSVTIDKIILEEIDALPIDERVIKLRQEVEALINDKYELLGHITLLQSHISKLQMLG